MAVINWNSFRVRINVKAPFDKLYDAWATRQGIEFWFLRTSEYVDPGGKVRKNDERVEKGDRYKWLWHGWPDEVVEYGEILDCNGKDFFKFSFGKAGICTMRTYQEEGEQIIELTQEDIPDTEEGRYQWHLGCKTGWTFYLANLKSLLENGIDLRNRNVKLQGMLNA